MGNKIQVFTNQAFGTVRTIEDQGRILFCGKDVATALGYTNTSKALQDHCKGVPFRYPLETNGGIQQVRFISEGDLYRLIVSSKLPSAQRFESWVFDEVLPSIRQHGLYATDELLANPEILLAMAKQLVANKQQIQELETKALIQAQQLAEARPKVSYYDLVLQSDSLLTTTEIAKDYGLSAKRLNRILRDAGIQFHQSDRWFLYARFAEQGYTQSKTHQYGDGKTRTHMYWTQKGRLFIYDLLKNKYGLLPVIEREENEDLV